MNANEILQQMKLFTLPVAPIVDFGFTSVQERTDQYEHQWKENGKFNRDLYEKYKQAINSDPAYTDGDRSVIFSYDKSSGTLQAYRLYQQPMDRAQIWISMYSAIGRAVSRRKIHLQ